MKYPGQQRAIALDLVGGAPRQQFLADERELAAAGVLKRKLVAPTEGPAIDPKQVCAALVSNHEVVAP